MPAFSIFLDNTLLARVCTDGFEVLAIQAGGVRSDNELADINMSAGSYVDEQEKIHLIWINSQPISANQELRIEYSVDGFNSHEGKTIEEMFPDDATNPVSDSASVADVLAEFWQRPSVRDGYSFDVRLPNGESIRSKSSSEDLGFGFSVLWNSYKPGRASVSLHTYTRESMEQSSPGTDHVRAYLRPGQEVSIKISAYDLSEPRGSSCASR